MRFCSKLIKFFLSAMVHLHKLRCPVTRECESFLFSETLFLFLFPTHCEPRHTKLRLGAGCLFLMSWFALASMLFREILFLFE